MGFGCARINSQPNPLDALAGGPEMNRPPIAIFFRDDEYWYPIMFMQPSECGRTMEQQAADHAELNPGTQRIEDIEGNVLWRPQ